MDFGTFSILKCLGLGLVITDHPSILHHIVHHIISADALV